MKQRELNNMHNMQNLNNIFLCISFGIIIENDGRSHTVVAVLVAPLVRAIYSVPTRSHGVLQGRVQHDK